MTKKKSKPIDSTMRNVKAANRRFGELVARIENLEYWLDKSKGHVQSWLSGSWMLDGLEKRAKK